MGPRISRMTSASALQVAEAAMLTLVYQEIVKKCISMYYCLD